MATYYDQFMEGVGTNFITTNAQFQAALHNLSDAYDQEQKAAEAQALFSFSWHMAILIAACLCAYFLWRIVQQNQNKLKAAHSNAENPKPSPDTNKRHADATHPKSKPPLLDSANQQNRQPQPSKAASAPNDSSASVHPDSRYMPKN